MGEENRIRGHDALREKNLLVSPFFDKHTFPDGVKYLQALDCFLYFAPMSRKANSSLDQPERKDRDWRACRRLTMLSFAFSRKRVKLQCEDDHHQGQFVRRVTDGSQPTFNVFSALLFRLRWSRSFPQLVNYAAASGCNRDPNPVSRAVFALELFRLSTNVRRKRVNCVRVTKSWSLIFFIEAKLFDCSI